MSINIFNKKTPSNGQKPVITSTIVIVIIIVIGISALSFFWGQNHANNTKSPIPIVDLSKIGPNSSNQRILGQEIYNWNGKIKEIKNSELIVKTNIKNPDGSYISKNLTIVLNKNTQIFKWDLSKPATKNEIENKTLISFSDLSVGNEIIFKSTKDLDASNEIVAIEINQLITPNY